MHHAAVLQLEAPRPVYSQARGPCLDRGAVTSYLVAERRIPQRTPAVRWLATAPDPRVDLILRDAQAPRLPRRDNTVLAVREVPDGRGGWAV